MTFTLQSLLLRFLVFGCLGSFTASHSHAGFTDNNENITVKNAIIDLVST